MGNTVADIHILSLCGSELASESYFSHLAPSDAIVHQFILSYVQYLFYIEIFSSETQFYSRQKIYEASGLFITI